MEGEEWPTDAVGPTMRKLAAELLQRMQRRVGSNSLLHFGQGKWYSGESLPRSAFTCFWRNDGEPVWLEPSLVADDDMTYNHIAADAKRFADTLAETRCRLFATRQHSIPTGDVVEAIADRHDVVVITTRHGSSTTSPPFIVPRGDHHLFGDVLADAAVLAVEHC